MPATRLATRAQPDPRPRTNAGAWLARQVVRFRDRETHVVVAVMAAVGFAVATVFAVLFAAVYDATTESDGVAGLDQPVLDLMVTARSPGLVQVANAFTQSGGPYWMPVVTTLVICLVAWRTRSWWPLPLMIVAVSGSLLMTHVGKTVVGRDRPPLTEAVPPYESSGSFPSGHSLNSLVIAGVLAYAIVVHLVCLLARVLTVVLAAIYASAMGLSRVFLGHHWLSDVLGAWALGAAWLAVLITGHRLVVMHRRARRQAAA